VVFAVNLVVSPPPEYVVSTRPTVRLSDQEFEHIVKDEREKTEKNHQPPPDEKTMVTFLNIGYHYYYRRLLFFTNVFMSALVIMNFWADFRV